jgi:hypothetical protein
VAEPDSDGATSSHTGTSLEPGRQCRGLVTVALWQRRRRRAASVPTGPGQAVLLVPLSATERPRASKFSSESCRLWGLGLVPVSWGVWVNTLTAVALRSCVPTAHRCPVPTAQCPQPSAQCPLIMIGRRLSRGCRLQLRVAAVPALPGSARMHHSSSESQPAGWSR